MESMVIDAPERTSPGTEPGEVDLHCFHCGEPCGERAPSKAGRNFCCQGCLIVHDLLTDNGLDQFYRLSPKPGVRMRRQPQRQQWEFLDDPSVQRRLLDFQDDNISRVTLPIPAIHCVACVWLLENLFRFNPAIGTSQVNFLKREVAIQFHHRDLPLSDLVFLLASIGYEPRLTLNDLEARPADPDRKRRWLQVGVAGFAFGNIMLFNLPFYLGLNSFTNPFFHRLLGIFSLVLALPVITYCASDYWRSAWLSLQHRALTLDVPIALGLAAIYARSTWEVFTWQGGGYLDSLSGLVFFLLCGRAFQTRTQEKIAFDRDYKSFFPLSVTRKSAPGSEEIVALSKLAIGDRLLLRNGELIPADSVLISGPALIDYSFVTGESEPGVRRTGDYLYAGGQQIGGRIEIETVKEVSQSYLTSLWNHDTFRKTDKIGLQTLTNRYSRRFTLLVIAVALGSGLFWLCSGAAGRGLTSFVSVLIVACPCALALAAPFALGTAQRLLTRLQIFLKNALVLERLARVQTIVFDKTGTLTATRPAPVNDENKSSNNHHRSPSGLSSLEQEWIHSLACHSTHPHALRIADLFRENSRTSTVSSFREIAGCGIEGLIDGHQIRLGSRDWFVKHGLETNQCETAPGSVICIAIDGISRGAFVLQNELRPEIEDLILELAPHYEIVLLSGDNERDRDTFQRLFGPQSQLHFNQSPLDKLNFISALQAQGRTVMMVGDGLNDAGALQQSDIGVAVVEEIGAFSPASDVILGARQVPQLLALLRFSGNVVRVVRASFAVSALYNLVGISIAAAGLLSPLVCAVLMPLSSISVVLFACGATSWAARRHGILDPI